MSAENWVKATGVPLPTCKMQGCCCRAASPSTPAHLLLEKAAQGDEFARDFFSIFVPHISHNAARQRSGDLVEQTLRAAQKDETFRNEQDVVFYSCRYIGDDNKCQIWEDRPQLCRDYPDSPFVVMESNCAFRPWKEATREKYLEMKAELEELEDLKTELENLREGTKYTKIDGELWSKHNLVNLSLVLSLTPIYLTSPICSYLE